MTSPDLAPAAQRLAELVTRVPDDELGRPTPCPAYKLGDLIEHIGTLARAFAASGAKTGGPILDQAPAGDASRLEPGWRERIPADLETLAATWARPEAWTGMTRIAGMDAPAEMVGITLADELAVHGWDVAQATGQPYDCDPEVLAAALSFLTRFTSPDAPAGPTVPFGPSRESPTDAPVLDQVVSLAGRELSWRAG
jgi:uncharacterized protein (TIGR03086 family)